MFTLGSYELSNRVIFNFLKDSILVSLFALNSTHVSTIKLVISTHLYEIQVETFIIAIFELNWNEIFEELID